MAPWRQEEKAKKPSHAGFHVPMVVLGRTGGEQRCHLLEPRLLPLDSLCSYHHSEPGQTAGCELGGGMSHMEPDDRIWQCRLHRWPAYVQTQSEAKA